MNNHNHNNDTHTNGKYSLKTFLPLITLYALALLITIIKQAVSGSWDLHSAMATFMGSVFILFGGFKIMNLRAFADAYAEYDLIAQRSRLYALAYPFIELGLGIAYFIQGDSRIVNIVTLFVMLISAAGVARALSQKRSIECVCMGTVFKLPMTYVTLGEDLLMAIMALGMLFA